MKRTTQKNSILLVCALLGVMVASQAMAANIRYQNSGNYTNVVAVTGAPGWQGGGTGLGGMPGTNDTARANFGNNTITLDTEAPLLRNFQLGVDESGQLLVTTGGILKTTGTQNSTVGNNGNANVTGRLTITAGGDVTVTNVLFVGAGARGIVTNDGGILRITSHLWVGSSASPAGIVGTIFITNNGVINVGGNIGLGTGNASTPSGNRGLVFVQDGGTLNLNQITPTNSIQPDSVLDVTGSGKVTIPGNVTAVISAYTNLLRITAYDGDGTVGIDYNNTNVGMTTIFAADVPVPPTNAVWDPAANPSGTGKWNEKPNWSGTGGLRPANVTKVNFNVAGAIPCTVTNAAKADYVVMGQDGPGGTLIITNGGSLAPVSTVNPTTIGGNSNAVMVVSGSGSASFGYQLLIGLDPGSDGTLIMNGGTVSVADMFALGSNGGKGTAQINGGTLNLSQWDVVPSIQGASVLDISGTGRVSIAGDRRTSVDNYIATGQITNHTGTLLAVDFGNITAGRTTIYSSDYYIPPALTRWNPALNLSDTDGIWNVRSNWDGAILPGAGTQVRFNIADAIPCILTNAVTVLNARLGLDGAAGTASTLIITNGGSLTANNNNDWNCIAMNSTHTALLVVENGGSANYTHQLWIGYDPGTDGTLTMNGGTVTVGQQFGLGWGGGTGHANINGGTLNLGQMDATQSINANSVLNVTGTGKVVLTGNHFASISNYVFLGRITNSGGPTVFYSFDPGVNRTTISAVLLPPPRQSATAVSVSGGNVSITYQTTHQHTYYIESTPSLSPASWTPVMGSTNAATGAPVTFTFPAGPDKMFYRTVSP